MENMLKPVSLRVRLTAVTGETMTETLVSVLISALALLMLATAIGSAMNIITTSRSRMNQLYSAESTLVDTVSSPATEGTVSLGVPISSDDIGHLTSVPVSIYSNSETSWYRRGDDA